MRCRYKLIGVQEGNSGQFGSFEFTDGYSDWLEASEKDWDRYDLQMLRFYSATRELAGDGNGSATIASEAEVQPDGSRAEAGPAAEIDGDGETEAGSSGSEAVDPGGHERTEDPLSLRQALDGLDPARDDHWHASGKPALSHLRAVTGEQILRAEVDQAASWLTRGHLAARAAEQ